jgi:hypothetical protein
MGIFNILNIKWNVIIMLIIVQNKNLYFQYIKKNHGICNCFDTEQW